MALNIAFSVIDSVRMLAENFTETTVCDNHLSSNHFPVKELLHYKRLVTYLASSSRILNFNLFHVLRVAKINQTEGKEVVF